MSAEKVKDAIGSGLRTLPKGLVITAIYALMCWSTRQVSLDQFLLPSGIRLAALLLIPPRMWPYLLLGDYLYLAQLRIPMLDRYGAEWVLISSIYQFPTAALVVYLSRGLVARNNDAWLLNIGLTCAALIGIGNLALAHLMWPSPPSGAFFDVALRYVLGHYIAIMTVVPLAMLWRRRSDFVWASWRRTSVFCSAIALVVCGAASTIVPEEAATAKATAQLLMAVPVVALTCLQGWWGAAIAMPMMNAFIRIGTPVSGLPESFDPDSFKVQLLVAISSTALLALGSRITDLYRKYSYQSKARRQAIFNARSSHSTDERQFRNRALLLRRIGDRLDEELSHTIELLRVRGQTDIALSLLDAATVHSQKFREQTSMVYPTMVEHVGLYLALQAGGAVDSWDQADRLVKPRLVGDPCRLSLDLQLTAYRALSEAVSLLLEHDSCKLKIRARCGRFGSA